MITQKIISFSEFMEMRYCDFKKIEATYFFMLNIKSGKTTKSKPDKEKTLQSLAKLDTVKASDLNLPPEYLSIF